MRPGEHRRRRAARRAVVHLVRIDVVGASEVSVLLGVSLAGARVVEPKWGGASSREGRAHSGYSFGRPLLVPDVALGAVKKQRGRGQESSAAMR